MSPLTEWSKHIPELGHSAELLTVPIELKLDAAVTMIATLAVFIASTCRIKRGRVGACASRRGVRRVGAF